MLILTKIADLQSLLGGFREQGLTIGFVPTMGALHKGHLSLIARSKRENSRTVCSIFVNPTQFNDKNDLERYPRTPEADIKMLESGGCDVVFMPDVDEMYPQAEKPSFDFGQLSRILEAAHRPGHFDGVAQVVGKFFNIVHPDKAYFGKKDYQQLMIITELGKRHFPKIEIVPCDIMREEDGLAMSSRNRLLTPEEREVASQIPLWLARAVRVAKTDGPNVSVERLKNTLSDFPATKLEYLAFCDPKTLAPLAQLSEGGIALMAMFVGRIRLIDNLQF